MDAKTQDTWGLIEKLKDQVMEIDSRYQAQLRFIRERHARELDALMEERDLALQPLCAEIGRLEVDAHPLPYARANSRLVFRELARGKQRPRTPTTRYRQAA